MAKGPQYNLPFRRRRTGRTHYGKREKLIASGATRFVVRTSNKHLAAQVVKAKPDGDLIIASAHSSELKEFGWKAPCGNLPAAYLTGLLAGKRAKANGTSDAILDIGLHARDAGSRLFAAAKGAIDAGLVIPHDESILPKKERIQGQHIGNYSKSMASQAERQRKMFAGYLKRKMNPEDLPTHFTEVESKIKSTGKETEK